jgi:hypothetical protein
VLRTASGAGGASPDNNFLCRATIGAAGKLQQASVSSRRQGNNAAFRFVC